VRAQVDWGKFARMTARAALTLAAVLLAVAVALGAFGAHALRSRAAPELLAVWQTAVQYHAWHALGLACVGLYLLHRPDGAAAGWSAWLFIAGIVLFSGSLYALVLTGSRALGAVTPVGGAAFIAGWLTLAWAVWRTA
jgi:uncharacterized membrane protein YgdD (TMEM256/DUF423 family)